jgi:phosphate/sulfate permease
MSHDPDRAFSSPCGTGAKAPCKYSPVCYGEGVALIRGGTVQRAHATLAERAGQSGGLAKRRLKSMVMGWIVTSVLAGIAGLVVFEAICEGAGCSEKLRDRYHE